MSFLYDLTTTLYFAPFESLLKLTLVFEVSMLLTNEFSLKRYTL